MEKDVAVPEYTLGLDLGSASVGWALVALDATHNPTQLLDAGVRIFEPGVEGSTLDIEQGKDKSKAVARREARLRRRQLRRRTARQRELFFLLQRKGLFPPALDVSLNASSQRHQVLNDLDKLLIEALQPALDTTAYKQLQTSLPYVLRKAALDRKLELFELGRVFYHLIQRRGFKSNRKEAKKNDELGAVKAGISELSGKIVASGARTLGEYFAGLNPHELRIRGRWTSRSMYESEFASIWEAQHQHWPNVLNEEFKSELCRLLFFQRPIAPQDHLIGFCELEQNERRSPWACLEAQRFRLLQKVNDLRVIAPGSLTEIPLAPDQRAFLFDLLDRDGDQTFAALRKHLGIKNAHFNLERGGEKKMRGNRTNALMFSIFKEFWNEMPDEEQCEAVTLWAKTESENEVIRLMRERWAIDEFTAKQLADSKPEDGYCSLSLKALRKVLPLMMQGAAYETARRQLYPELFLPKEAKALVPTVHDALPTLRNPSVERALTETRKVVNAIVRQYGKPYEIRIEMARELRKPRKEREDAWRRNRVQEKQRQEAKKRILQECGIQNPSRDDVDKALLFDECGGICPYTGKTIEFSSLFGESQFDIEHIIPQSRCPENSFANKTLCYHEENRSVKRGRTPWEAYGADEDRWNLILQRVQAWKPGNIGKFKRFQLRSEEQLNEFTERQMNDTRYTTRLAVEMLSTLYGGREMPRGDGTNRRVIHATTGMVTAALRRNWGLEAILREAVPSNNGVSKGKPRTDHRHHAIDAITIALSNQAIVQRMSTAAAAAVGWQSEQRSYRTIQSPWPNFVDSIRPNILGMLVSHRPEHKMSGELHKDTFYGRPYICEGKSVVNLRRRLSELTISQADSIVDPAVREIVKKKFIAHGGDASKFNQEDSASLPQLISRDGTVIPIKKVRVREVKNEAALIRMSNERYVQSDEIHHIELFVRREGRREYWSHVTVTLMDAYSRRRRGIPVVQKCHPDDIEAVFLFSLMKGDTVELEHLGNRSVFRVKKFYSAGQIWFTQVNNAQPDKDQQRDKTRWSKTPDSLKEMKPRKVSVDLLGRVHPAND